METAYYFDSSYQAPTEYMSDLWMIEHGARFHSINNCYVLEERAFPELNIPAHWLAL